MSESASRMKREWLPRPSHLEQVDALAGLFASIVDGRTAWYVSSPLTTGLRAFEWHVSRGVEGGSGQTPDDGRFRHDVIEPNREAAAQFVRRLRSQINSVVIDPTAMGDVPGWAQPDYHFFWGVVIDRYAQTAVFRDGWMYSTGCTYEFLVAYESGAKTLQEDLSPLTLSDAIESLTIAIEERRAANMPVEFLREVAAALNEHAMTGGR